MKKTLLNFKANKLFPFQFQLLGIVFIIVGLVLLLFKPYLAPVFILCGGTILSSYRGVEFDRSQNTYREYNSFLFLNFGPWQKLDAVEKIFISKTNVSQKIYTMITTGTVVRKVEYNAYLKLVNGSKIYLISNRNKDFLLKKLRKISDFFDLEIAADNRQ